MTAALELQLQLAVEGTGFSAIKYEGKDTDKLGIKYKRISDFWLQFEKIRDEKPIV